LFYYNIFFYRSHFGSSGFGSFPLVPLRFVRKMPALSRNQRRTASATRIAAEPPLEMINDSPLVTLARDATIAERDAQIAELEKEVAYLRELVSNMTVASSAQASVASSAQADVPLLRFVVYLCVGCLNADVPERVIATRFFYTGTRKGKGRWSHPERFVDGTGYGAHYCEDCFKGCANMNGEEKSLEFGQGTEATNCDAGCCVNKRPIVVETVPVPVP